MPEVIDKKGILKTLSGTDPVILELGCGNRKRNVESIGIDVLDYPEVDLVGDVFEVLRRFPDSCVDSVAAYHFIEHIGDLDFLMSELERVVIPDGTVEFVAPHFSNPYYYSDPTHRIFFGLYTFSYFCNSTIFSRKVPNYQKEPSFDLEQVNLIFKSARPFFGRYVIKSVIGVLFDSCTYMRELYEENFCYLFPCYEIQYLLRRIDGNER